MRFLSAFKSLSFSTIVLAVVVFLMPLIFNPLGFDMYGVPKNLVLKVGISLLLIVVAVWFFRQKKLEVMMTKNTLKYVVIFLFILALSEMVALRPNISFWGSYFRQGGVINMLNYVCLFLLSLVIFVSKKSRDFILNVVIFSGVVSSIYAIFQKFGFDFFTADHTALFVKRSFAGMGNPTALGAFLLFPIGAQLLKMKESKRVKGVVPLFLMGIALVFTRNRASLLGLLVAVGLYLFRRVWSKPKWRIYWIGGMLTVLFAFVFVYGNDMRSVGSRLTIWSSGVEMIQARPVLGYGPESFDVLFERFVHPDFFQYEDYKNLVDRPHNEFLETWIHWGLAGVVFYVGFWWFLLSRFWFEKSERVRVLSLTIIALLVSNLFGFSLVTHYVLFVIFWALIISELGRKKKVVIKNLVFRREIIWGLIVLAGLNGFFVSRMVVGDYYLADAFFSVAKNDIERVDQSLKYALKFNSSYGDTFKNAYDVYYSLAATFPNENWLLKAAEVNSNFEKITANNLVSLLNEARIWGLIADYDQAEAVYRRIAETKGVNPSFYEEWANMYADSAQYDKAVVIYDELFSVLPLDWHAPLLTNGELTTSQHVFWKLHGNFTETLDKARKAYVAVGRIKDADAIVNALK